MESAAAAWITIVGRRLRAAQAWSSTARSPVPVGMHTIGCLATCARVVVLRQASSWPDRTTARFSSSPLASTSTAPRCSLISSVTASRPCRRYGKDLRRWDRQVNRVFRASWYRFSATFRHKWGSYLTISLLLGLIGGLAMGSLAAARRTQPDHSRLVGLLPDGCVQPAVCKAGQLHVGAHLQVGQVHGNKPTGWIVARYFGQFNRSRRNRWVFGDRSSGAYLLKFAWTRIVRHQMAPGTASPDDPALTEYWARRRRRATPPLDGISPVLFRAQAGRCPVCGGLLLFADHEPTGLSEWEQWLTVTRKAVRKKPITAERGPGMPGGPIALHLVHAHCRQRRLAAFNVPGASVRP